MNARNKMADVPTSAPTQREASNAHAQTLSWIWRPIVVLALVRYERIATNHNQCFLGSTQQSKIKIKI